MPASEPSVISGVIGALTFYIFSCGCFAARPQRNREAKKVTRHLWREEIENHPSSFRGSGTATPHTIPSTPNNEPAVEPTSMLELGPTLRPSTARRAATMAPGNLRRADVGLTLPPRAATMPRPSTSSTQSRRINPPVNERHPPVVSAVSEHEETGWMTLPPPTQRETAELNRHINRNRGLGLGLETMARTRSGAGADGRPGSAVTQTSMGSGLPLEVENLVAYGGSGAGYRRKRFEEGVLEDMEGPVSFGFASRRGTEEAARGKG